MTDGAGWIVDESLGARLRISEEYVVLEDHWIPRVLEILLEGDGEPETFARVEVNESGPKLVELRFSSVDPDARGIRQADLRGVVVAAVVEDFVAGFTFRVQRDEAGGAEVLVPVVESPAYADALRFVGRMRAGRTSRDITPQLLERVAAVYRDNIAGRPTKAVEHHFQVSQRMAAEYVSRARKRGLLPPTKRGKKQA